MLQKNTPHKLIKGVICKMGVFKKSEISTKKPRTYENGWFADILEKEETTALRDMQEKIASL